MATETLQITKLVVLNNYLKISGDLGPKGATRAVEYFYPKASTNFSKYQVVTESGKGQLIANFYSLSNHMNGGKCVIPELLIGSITDGETAFTTESFINFCTLNTGV
tara:strand:+ start:7548 stop:7868 length:321 start_codon:yes stop_codon:yes gene_type:complete